MLRRIPLIIAAAAVLQAQQPIAPTTEFRYICPGLIGRKPGLLDFVKRNF